MDTSRPNRTTVRTTGRTTGRRTRTAALALLLASVPTVVAGCGDDDTTSSDTAATTAATTATTTTAASGGTDTAVAKVDANEASIDELAAAFEAAGVPNAERWAHEVDEYRPYTDDGWAHLRQELSKYNIDDATFDRIVSTLQL